MAKITLSVTGQGTFASGGFMGDTPKEIESPVWKLARYVIFKTVVLKGFNTTLVKTISFTGANDISMSEKAYIKLLEFVPYYLKAMEMLKDKGVEFFPEENAEGHKTLTIKIKSGF